MRYALYPHAGDMVDVTRQACAFPSAAEAGAGADVWTAVLGRARANVVLETVKLAEDSQDIVLRMYECLGASCTARLRTGFEAESASVCDLLDARDCAADDPTARR